MDLIVVEVHYQKEPLSGWGDVFDEDRVPLIHEPGKLYVGLPGAYHQALKDEFRLKGTGRGPGQSKGWQELGSKNVGWYGANRPAPEELEAIHATLGGQAPPPAEPIDWEGFFEGSWTASFLAAQGLNVVQVDSPDWNENYDMCDPDRVPWKYDSVKGNIFVGRPGYFHMNVASAPEFDREAARRTHDGYMHLTDGYTRWYEHPGEDDAHAVERAVANHLGIAPYSQPSQEQVDNADLWE